MRKLAFGRNTILDEPKGDVPYQTLLNIRYDCREYCSNHHIEVPEWAKKRHHHQCERKDYLNITEDEKKRNDYRLKARIQAIEMGIPIPDWAKKRKKSKHSALLYKSEKKKQPVSVDFKIQESRFNHFAVLTELNLSCIAQGFPQYVQRAAAYAAKCGSDELCNLISSGDIDGAREKVMSLISERFGISFTESRTLAEEPKKICDSSQMESKRKTERKPATAAQRRFWLYGKQRKGRNGQ